MYIRETKGSFRGEDFRESSKRSGNFCAWIVTVQMTNEGERRRKGEKRMENVEKRKEEGRGE